MLKTIGESFKDKCNVDYLHCSADEDSLDGIIIKEKNIAIVDGTKPHIIDPITPGVVDKIINLGEYWDENAIVPHKAQIIDLNEKSSENYNLAYTYLSSAEKLYNGLETIFSKSMDTNEIYHLCEDIIKREYSNMPVKLRPGRIKKFFASAITASGYVNYLPNLLKGCKHIYMINSPIGYNNNSFMEIIKEGAVYRGYDAECFYCPMKPNEKIEHIIIPEIKVAFITTNDFHDMEPWQVFDEEKEGSDEPEKDVILLDISDYMNGNYVESRQGDIDMLQKHMNEQLRNGISYLAEAKKYHSQVEKIYIESMNFGLLNKFVDNLIESMK